MQRGYVSTRAGQIHYATAGDAKGIPLVLLPQGGRSSFMYKELAAELADEYQIFALDYPGSGWSDPLPEHFGFRDIAATFIDVLDNLGHAQAIVYGLHTGNKVAAAMAAGWPHRVNKVILAGQSHSIVPNNVRRTKTVGTTRRKLFEAKDAREATLLQWADIFSVVSGVWWGEKSIKNLTDKASRDAAIIRASDELLSAESIPALYRANFSYDLEGDLRKITVPTLILEIVSPREDVSIGRQGTELLSMIANAQLELLEEPDFHGNTLEHRAADLASILRRFIRDDQQP